MVPQPEALMTIASRPALAISRRQAAAGAAGDDDVAAVAGQQADGCLVDRGGEHLLRAAAEQCDAALAFADGGKYLRAVDR
jgi:hypothetical protein